MGRQFDTTGERSGVGPTYLHAFQNTEAVIFISKTQTFEKSVLPWGSISRPLTLQFYGLTTRLLQLILARKKMAPLFKLFLYTNFLYINC
ncbi:unnamed protein product [Chrysodeixis includens]|uniref:Uncharacterized protein n=1 Tax=Chrysodeixis includens TaxID=689277 RepID=A0A9N8L050_CHRIL|nr:unnamed protein product [Chrysodeixis includens]